MDKCGLDSHKVDAQLPHWREMANTLIERLNFESEDKLTEDDRYATNVCVGLKKLNTCYLPPTHTCLGAHTVCYQLG